MRGEGPRKIRNISIFCSPGKEIFFLYGNVRNRDLNSPIAKKIKISPNQRSPFIVHRRDNKIGGKTQLARNYPIATEPFVAYCLTPEKRNVCVWIMRMSKVYLRGENDGVRLEFLIKKRNFCRVMKSLQLAKACVISRWYQIALSRE